jgi:hypothetical protein
MIYARAQAIYDDYAGEMTSEIKQWRRYWKRCRYLVKIVETEKLAMEPEAGERVTYDGVAREGHNSPKSNARDGRCSSDGRDAEGSRLGYVGGSTILGERKGEGQLKEGTTRRLSQDEVLIPAGEMSRSAEREHPNHEPSAIPRSHCFTYVTKACWAERLPH